MKLSDLILFGSTVLNHVSDALQNGTLSEEVKSLEVVLDDEIGALLVKALKHIEKLPAPAPTTPSIPSATPAPVESTTPAIDPNAIAY